SGLRWDDPTINIDWKFEEFNITEEDLTISDKDKVQQLFDKNNIYFV
nr:dTDP-4-dehydrorhamnose 3,5-epimerase family protein [Leptotrichiaceae bacterium]